MGIIVDDTVKLPDDIERGARGGPTFNTDVIISSSGHVSTNQRWSLPLYKWDIGYGIQTMEDVDAILQVFIGARGRVYGFRFKDWSDYQIPLITNVIGTGDGAETDFQIYKTYTNGVRTLQRKITRPVDNGTIEVQVAGTPYTEGGGGGTGYTVDYSTGIISFNVAPPNLNAVYCKCEFDIPVMFESDEIGVVLETYDAAEIDNIIVMEIRE